LTSITISSRSASEEFLIVPMVVTTREFPFREELIELSVTETFSASNWELPHVAAHTCRGNKSRTHGTIKALLFIFSPPQFSRRRDITNELGENIADVDACRLPKMAYAIGL
jgi:hypothetical protein